MKEQTDTGSVCLMFAVAVTRMQNLTVEKLRQQHHRASCLYINVNDVCYVEIRPIMFIRPHKKPKTNKNKDVRTVPASQLRIGNCTKRVSQDFPQTQPHDAVHHPGDLASCRQRRLPGLLLGRSRKYHLPLNAPPFPTSDRKWKQKKKPKSQDPLSLSMGFPKLGAGPQRGRQIKKYVSIGIFFFLVLLLYAVLKQWLWMRQCSVLWGQWGGGLQKESFFLLFKKNLKLSTWMHYEVQT